LTLAPAAVLAERPDVRAANLRLEQQTALKVSEAVSVFPSISLTALFGVAAPVFANPVAIWNVAGGIAMNLLDFGRLGGRIDAAAAREAEAYAAWRKAVLLAIEDVEGALTTAARTKEQRVALEAARKHASSALALAETRYRAGESSLLEVLDSQRQVIEADSALVTAQSEFAAALVALYRATGVY
jgi:multidrug efflux system outer membrane protein